MKKRLESELISIAHRILKLKNKSEVDQLHLEAKKLYETLTVLKFYGDNYEQIQSEITQEDFEEKLDNLLLEPVEKPTAKKNKKEVVALEKVEEQTFEEEVIAETEAEEETIEEQVIAEAEVEEEIENEITAEEIIEVKEESFDPIFELASNEIIEDEVTETPVSKNEKMETQQISFDDLLGENYTEPVFVKPSEIKENNTVLNTNIDEVLVEKTEVKSKSLNDLLSKGINIGLNDRIAFVKHLFAESNEDFNRVISQLNTLDTIDEAKDFIENMVKPDYNNWNGKDDYAARFIEMVEKKFN